MKKKSNHIELYKHLTQTELIDYAQGVLGNEEMYRLELHLNECELCSDALDGVSMISNPKGILDSINTQIHPFKKEVFTFNYMAIAASVALVAVLGLSYWLITNPAQVDTVAINSASEIAEEKADPNNLIGATSVEKVEETIDESMTESESQNSGEDSENIILTSKKPTASETPPPTKQKSMIRQKEVEEPLVAVADVSGEMAKEEDVSQLEEIILEPANEDNLISEKAQPIQSSSRASKKSKRSTTTAHRKDQKEPEPIGGMASLKTYLNQNLKYPQAAIDNNIKGTVVLVVIINTDGSIANITVSKGLGNGCDAEAMRLISTGPEWTPKVVNGKAVKSSRQVKIKFKK